MVDNFHFKVCENQRESNIYILADSYDSALDILFDRYMFDNYEFLGISN